MSNTPSLLPCPFCGGINIIHCGHHMYCHACGADGPDADSQHESEAIAAWNRRTPQPVVREPLGNKELQAISLEYSDSEDECTGFRDGWRFAEKHYGITQKGADDGA